MELGYLLYLPKDYTQNKKTYPLMLFLHGMGKRGNDLSLVKMHGPPKLVEAGQDFPFIIVSPQCPLTYEYWPIDFVAVLLDEITACYRVDPNRIYLTGLSMGGYGTWDLATEYPDRFDAIAPICGGNADKAARLKNIPVWAFHGAKDPLVPIKESQKWSTPSKKPEETSNSPPTPKRNTTPGP